ncbi:MAG: Nramp family divalent metal transporter [Candidatus Limnocylindrales bacterium]
MTKLAPRVLPRVGLATTDEATAALGGDITGALGTIRANDSAPRISRKARIGALLAILGPGLVVMVGDNDAGGVATYAQAGQNYGTSLLWTLLLLIPVLIVNQEMAARLGLVSGVGHARMIFARFGTFWGTFSAIDLFVLNFLTLVTEFIGVRLALGYFGLSPLLSVPLAAGLLIAMTVTGSFRRWERYMFVTIGVSLLMIPLALFSHPESGPILHDTVVPSVAGGLDPTALLVIIAIVGTTVAPWQLFFQQSNVIDKRLVVRWINYERIDTILGAVLTNVGAGALLVATAFAFAGTQLAGTFTDAGAVAEGLRQYAGPVAGTLFAIVLLNAALIGAEAVTLSTSYVFGDVFGVAHSLHRSVGEAKLFYSLYSVLILAAAGIVLIPDAPLGLITIAVQALAGVLLPSACVFLLLLCNDRAVLGPWVNPGWLNVVGSIIVGILLVLSFSLAATTLFPDIDLLLLEAGLNGALLLGLAILGISQLRSRQARPARSIEDRANWRMPPLEELPQPIWSVGRRLAMLALRGYLVIAALLLIVKIGQLAFA